jgi:simple sugar transport system permease protein
MMMVYALRREKIDVVVLGGLSLVLTAVALAAWNGAAGDGIGMASALWETIKVPSQLIQSLPYLFVVIVLAGFVGKAIPPRAGGQPYVKER